MTRQPTVFAASTVKRDTPRVCTLCLQEIRPGALFRVGEPPRHAWCDPPPRLDVAKLTHAARTR